MSKLNKMCFYYLAEKSSIYSSYTKAMILEGLASEFIDGVDISFFKIDVKEQKSDMPVLMIREKITRFQFNPIKIIIGKRRRDVFKLGDYIPPTRARNIWIVTRGRSGSSFLGDMLNRYPGTFYSFEPLHYKDGILGKEGVANLLEQVFQCNPENGYFAHAKKWKGSLSRNFRLWNVCQSILRKNEACFIPELYYSTCPIFPIRLVKTIRLPFKEVERFLIDSEIGNSLKIVFLFRDPRGVFQSLISKTRWLKAGERNSGLTYLNSCKISSICEVVDTDVSAAVKLKEKYSGTKIHEICFENIII